MAPLSPPPPALPRSASLQSGFPGGKVPPPQSTVTTSVHSTEALPGHEGACGGRESRPPPSGARHPARGQPGEQSPQVEAGAPQETHMLTHWTGHWRERSRTAFLER